MVLRILNLGDDPETVGGFGGRKYYRLATITWSKPREWRPADRVFDVPAGWAGHGGVYAFIRPRAGQPEIAYIGKAEVFEKRLKNDHNHFDIVERRGATLVSCGRVAFERIQSRTAYYLELEELIKFPVHWSVENVQGMESLPGFLEDAAPRDGALGDPQRGIPLQPRHAAPDRLPVHRDRVLASIVSFEKRPSVTTPPSLATPPALWRSS